MPPLLVIVGETASGKSALAMELAQRLNGEIICADSWTVYRGFDVGSAKPSPEEQRRVRHHLLDVADPRDGFSAVLFKRLANQAITDINARGRLPIMVGGTGLYVDSVIYDYSFLPASDPALRTELNKLSLQQLHERASQLELTTAGIDARNKRRVVRLIENNGQLPTKRELRANTLTLGIQTVRDDLRQRIEHRVDAMLAAGLESEVKELVERYGWEVEAMKGIGYREWQPYFSDQQSLAVTRQRIVKATLDLAKRQRTWFNRNSSIQWLEDRSKISEIADLVTTTLNK